MPSLRTSDTDPGPGPLGLVFPVLALAVFATVVVRCAWICDDAYITFRTAANFWDGAGLVWNPGWRVQAYTHPLWLLVAIVCQGGFGEVYFSMLFASLGLAVGWVGWLAWSGRAAPLPTAALVLALSASLAVVEYSTSGLENALLSVCLVMLVVVLPRCRSAAGVAGVGALASAAVLCRPDAALLVGPAVAYVAMRALPEDARKRWAALALGLAPLALWELFSLVYYGSLVPNTALAKLNVEVSLSELARQGARYYLDSLVRDPVTLGLLGAAIAVTAARGRATERVLALGIVLYGLYLVRIGGDFMSGRFFAAPTAMAAALLARELVRLRPAVGAGLLALAVAYGSLWSASPWRSGADYGTDAPRDSWIAGSGIADERAYYYPATGLRRVWPQRHVLSAAGGVIPPHPAARSGRELARARVRVAVTPTVGLLGYWSGDGLFLIDELALADSFLSRIRARPEWWEEPWRIGHNRRRLPAGYARSLRRGRNFIVDPELAALFDDVSRVARDPLFDGARWRAIWRLNTGAHAAASVHPDYAWEPGAPR